MLALLPLMAGACEADASSRNIAIDPPASGGKDDAVELTGAAELNEPSAFPVDAEWRERFNSSVPNLVETERRYGNEKSRRIEWCMRRKGFDFSVGRATGEEIDTRVAINPLKQVTISFGYHLPPQPEVTQRTENVTPEMARALDGGDAPSPPERSTSVPKEASDVPCTQESTIVQLEDSRTEMDAAWTALSRSMNDELRKYDDTKEALTRGQSWADCMESAGFDYTNPSEPRLEYGDQPNMTDIAIETRRADYRCDLESDLTVARSNWQREHYERWRLGRAASLNEFESMVAEFSTELAEAESESLD